MKKITFLLILFVGVFDFTSCKKGEDDPAFSLLTRKERLNGDWKMDKGIITIGIKDSTGSYAALLYNLDNNHYTYDEVGKGAHFDEKCNLQISFSKKGVFTIKQVMDSISLEANGSWDFEGGVGKNKKKEKIDIQLNTINNYFTFVRLFNKSQENFVYTIKELRSKKLVLMCEEEMVVLQKGIGIYISAEYTFSPK